MRLSQISKDFNRLNKTFKEFSETLMRGLENLTQSSLSAGSDSLWQTVWASIPNKPWTEKILNHLKPAILGLGLRITHLSPRSLQAVLPARKRNLNRFGALHEGLFITAAVECSHLLVMQAIAAQVPAEAGLKIDFTDLQLQMHSSAKEDVTLRLEISDAVRESIWSQLDGNKTAKLQWMVQFFDSSEKLVATLNSQIVIEMSSLLNWKV